MSHECNSMEGYFYTCVVLIGEARERAIKTIKDNHYTRSVPSGKSHYMRYADALMVFSIPANKNLAKFLLPKGGTVWELSRLWAPDGHEKNLLTKAMAQGIKVLTQIEGLDLVVSYADPNVGHKGGVYRAASWIYHGKSEEVRTYISPSGETVARRAFHSGKKGLTKAEIQSRGFIETKLPGKERFVKPLSRKAKKQIKVK